MIWTQYRGWQKFEIISHMLLYVIQTSFQTIRLLLDVSLPSPYTDQSIMHLPQVSLNVIHEINSVIVIILSNSIKVVQGTT